MGHSHAHSHDHSSTKNLKLAFWVNLFFSIFEIIGGIYVNSVAIISDAIHELGDSISLGSAWYLENKSKQEADSKFSFGYARYSLLSALINSIVLLLGSGFVIYFYPTPYIDPILSLTITAYILYGVVSRLREALHFFLQGAPKEIDLKKHKNKYFQFLMFIQCTIHICH